MIRERFTFFNVGETYIKFSFEYSEASKDLIKQAYLKQVGLTSDQFLKFREHHKISIEYEKGSTKTRIVVWGSALSLYFAIGNYGDFRAGVREIVDDAKTFSSLIIQQIDNDPNISPDNILNSQRRTGVPGRLEDVYRKVEHLERNIENLSNNEMQTQLAEIKQEVSNLISLLPEQDSQAFIESFDNRYAQNLPQPDDKKTQYLYSRYALKPDDDIDIVGE